MVSYCYIKRWREIQSTKAPEPSRTFSKPYASFHFDAHQLLLWPSLPALASWSWTVQTFLPLSDGVILGFSRSGHWRGRARCTRGQGFLTAIWSCFHPLVQLPASCKDPAMLTVQGVSLTHRWVISCSPTGDHLTHGTQYNLHRPVGCSHTLCSVWISTSETWGGGALHVLPFLGHLPWDLELVSRADICLLMFSRVLFF